jgi:hypothetical protein
MGHFDAIQCRRCGLKAVKAFRGKGPLLDEADYTAEMQVSKTPARPVATNAKRLGNADASAQALSST